MSWDSVCHAWSESNRLVRAKLWDSWDWKENLELEQAKRQVRQVTRLSYDATDLGEPGALGKVPSCVE